jgi:hypothetical protein
MGGLPGAAAVAAAGAGAWAAGASGVLVEVVGHLVPTPEEWCPAASQAPGVEAVQECGWGAGWGVGVEGGGARAPVDLYIGAAGVGEVQTKSLVSAAS